MENDMNREKRQIKKNESQHNNNQTKWYSWYHLDRIKSSKLQATSTSLSFSASIFFSFNGYESGTKTGTVHAAIDTANGKELSNEQKNNEKSRETRRDAKRQIEKKLI